MERITDAMLDGDVRVMLLLGTDMLSSFADATRVAAGLARTDLVVAYDLFLNDTARRFADVVLPATAWLEELGCKATNTHLYLMPKVIEAPGATRPIVWVLRELAGRLGLGDFYPWDADSGPLDAILDHPATGHASVAALDGRGRDAGAARLARRPPGSEVPDAVGQDRARTPSAPSASACRRCPCTRRRPPRPSR